jgi:serine/threonine protein kinase
MLQINELFHGRYRVLRSIKAGGAGVIYEIQDEVTSRRRALKVMLPGTIKEASLRRRFAQEAKISGAIESDHIAQVSDAGIDEGSDMPFIVMDLLQGQDLASLSQSRGPLPAADVVLYLSHVALALDKTHAAGIVHRDLKPENLFLTMRDDGSPCVKVVDFGVAKAIVAHPQAERTAVVGTPLYMSPEQIRGDGTVGPGADIYALGHVAYTLLTGEAYWALEAKHAISVFALFHKMLSGNPEAPAARAGRRGVVLPPAFDAWFAAATALDPIGRPEGALAAVALLADALEAPGDAAPSPRTEPPAPPKPSSWQPPPPALRSEIPSAFAPTVKGRPATASPSAEERRRIGREAMKKSEEHLPLFKDELTQVYSERYLKIRLEEEYMRARKQGTRLAVLVLAADRPRRISEAPEKDLAASSLQRLSSAILAYAPPGGFLARHGDRAFALLVPGAGATQSRAIATVLAQKVANRLLNEKTGPLIKFRLGVAHLEKTDRSGRHLLERAESAMPPPV